MISPSLLFGIGAIIFWPGLFNRTILKKSEAFEIYSKYTGTNRNTLIHNWKDIRNKKPSPPDALTYAFQREVIELGRYGILSQSYSKILADLIGQYLSCEEQILQARESYPTRIEEAEQKLKENANAYIEPYLQKAYFLPKEQKDLLKPLIETCLQEISDRDIADYPTSAVSCLPLEESLT
ncbi:MAG: hypothetical protein KR126chlam2_01068 [Chlamydiae bacterium]|nr:hypothetical protein [Chlamydiota bacterium]